MFTTGFLNSGLVCIGVIMIQEATTGILIVVVNCVVAVSDSAIV